MARYLFLNSVAGVAGDMFTAAFVDAGLVSVQELNALVDDLGLAGVRIRAEPVIQATVQVTRLAVEVFGTGHSVQSGHHHHDNGETGHHQYETHLVMDAHAGAGHTHYSDVDGFIGASALETDTKDLARRVFRTIAEAEAAVHGMALEQAVFHELGTIDSIMDVVMAAYCLNKVNADRVYATPLKVGRGSVHIAHGTHPIPPPASARLLVGMQVAETPAAITRENVELSTPTGIAILRTLNPVFTDEMPRGRLIAQGSGSGTMDLGSYPNVFQVKLVEAGESELPYESDAVVEIACNIDDDTGEHIGWICSRLLEMGALDVWQTPATGKKGRSMVCLQFICSEEDFGVLVDWLLRNSTTFGARYQKWQRLKLARELEEREVDGRQVRFKIGRTTTGEYLKEKAEFDDMAD
jgi:pyridinium-3,5-bisthiocarboxylic acid mononucleotide nickel chelatase